MQNLADFNAVGLGISDDVANYLAKHMGKDLPRFETWETLSATILASGKPSVGIVFTIPTMGELPSLTFGDTWNILGCQFIPDRATLQFIPMRPMDKMLAILFDGDFEGIFRASVRTRTTSLRQLEMVNEVARNLATLHDVRAILTTITDELINRFGYYHATVGVIEGNDIVMYEASPRSRASADRLFRLKIDAPGTLPWVARHGTARLVHDTQHDDIWVAGAGLEASRSELTVPMLLHGTTLGIIDIQSIYVNAFDETDLWLIEALAGQLAVALKNATLVQELSQRAEEVSALLETSKAISAALPEDTRFNVIVQQARDLLAADNVILFELDTENNLLKPLAAIHRYLNAVMQDRIYVGEGLSGQVVQRGEGMIVNYDDEPYATTLHRIPGTPDDIECLMSVPLKLEDRILGSITVTREGHRQFTDRDLNLLTGFANLVAIGLNNARLVEVSMRQRERAETLNRVARTTSTILNVEELLKTIINLLPSFIPFETAVIGLVKDNLFENVQSVGYEHLDPNDLSNYFNKLSVFSEVLREQKTVLLHHSPPDAAWGSLPEYGHIQSWIGVPLITHRVTMGILAISSVLPDFYSTEDSAQLRAFANQIALAIENAQLYQRLARREKRATTLHEVTRHLNLLDAKMLVSITLQYLARGMPFNIGVIALVGAEYQFIWHLMENVAEKTLQDLKMQIVKTLRLETDLNFSVENFTERITMAGTLNPNTPEIYTLNSKIEVLLRRGHEVIGMLALYHTDKNVYDDLDERTLQITATALGTALENAWLVDELKARAIYLQHAYDEIAEADRLKDELVQNVSHELRTPLTFIKGYVELFLEDGIGELSIEQREKLQIIANKTNTLIRLVGDIVSSQRLERHNLQLEEVQMADVIAQMVAMVMPTIQQEKRRIIVDIAPHLPVIMADVDRIIQVLNNLIINALKFSPQGTDILIRAFEVKQAVRIEVEDKGIGISENQQERIFERFYQADGTTKRRYSGVGLGLAISKQIIQAHDGSIGVLSTPGQGSCFYFELPLTANPKITPIPKP